MTLVTYLNANWLAGVARGWRHVVVVGSLLAVGVGALPAGWRRASVARAAREMSRTPDFAVACVFVAHRSRTFRMCFN